MRPLLVFFALLLLAPACPPAPTPPPGPDVADAAPMPDAAPRPAQDAASPDAGADACTLACVNLHLLNCPEADDEARCVDGCRAARGVLIARKSVDCWITSKSVAGVRACGSVGCAR